MRAVATMLASCLWATAAACGESSTSVDKASTTCHDAVSRTITLGESALATLPAAQRHASAQALPPMRDAMMQRCRNEAWPLATRRCFVAAATSADVMACDLTTRAR
ncbi:MAG: hypothetical protein IPL79_00395 [Myxococcales bacterium]|nr:hypothetical protein [Myxococcales bacterium]